MLKEKLDDWALDHVPGPIYRIPTRIKGFFRSIKYFFQKIFRKNHTSDLELWNLHHYMMKFIYPKLKAFKKMKRMGFPGDFVEYDEGMWKSREEYDEALASGKIQGGGPEAWEETLDEILFAFEYFLHHENEKYVKNFYRKWGLKDPHEEIEENLSHSYWYEDGENCIMTGEPISEEEMKEKGYVFKAHETMYYNPKLDIEYGKRARKGFELFGKYFLNFWD